MFSPEQIIRPVLTSFLHHHINRIFIWFSLSLTSATGQHSRSNVSTRSACSSAAWGSVCPRQVCGQRRPGPGEPRSEPRPASATPGRHVQPGLVPPDPHSPHPGPARCAVSAARARTGGQRTASSAGLPPGDL